MSNQQTRWASTHDWYVQVMVVDGVQGVEVYDSMDEQYITFTNFAELYAWAGY